MLAAKGSSDYLSALNPAQRQAATFGERHGNRPFEAGPLLVVAGAGTGKTMTLAHRVAHLVIEGVDTGRILLLTFTRRAAAEMTRRVESIVRSALAADRSGTLPAGVLPWSGTFHSVGNRLLRRFAFPLGLDPGFSVLDRSDAADLMDVSRHELGLSKRSRRFPRKDTCLAIYSRCVNARADLGETIEDFYPWCGDWERELRELFRHYVDRKQQAQALDYDDLLLYWLHLVSEPDYAAEIGSWFDHVLVDEYQDTNLLQSEILHALKPDGSGVTVVGDDAQSIYSFRAAEVENILDFPSRFEPMARVVTLTRNYRSTQSILDSANCLIASAGRQYRKSLETDRGVGATPRYVTVEDGDAEAEFVVESVLSKREEGLRLRDQAILFRGAHHSDRLEIELIRRNIPYVKYGGLKFLEAGHVKDVLSILKWAENPRNEMAAFRVLKLLPGMGPSNAGRCFEHMTMIGHSFSALRSFRPPPVTSEEWPGFCELMEALSSCELDDRAWQAQMTAVRKWYRPHLERIYDGVETREADIEQLEQMAGRYSTRERFLTELTLDPPSAAGDLAGDPLLDEDYLILSTVHSAKGQEWDAVFLLNVTDGSFPSEFSTGKPKQIEEERRLMYVAMTRARQSLTLIAPMRFHVTQQAPVGDKHVYGARSRFVTDALLATMQQCWHGRRDEVLHEADAQAGPKIDVAARMREMW
jgi:DNA helicase-2/ATP-dependent DNA helicase PcrA